MCPAAAGCMACSTVGPELLLQFPLGLQHRLHQGLKRSSFCWLPINSPSSLSTLPGLATQPTCPATVLTHWRLSAGCRCTTLIPASVAR